MENLQIEKPSYYAIIPSDVRYDKDLIPMAKLLYGEITALANTYGYCFATNKYFEKIYEVSKRTVTNWLNSLKKKEYIETELIKDDRGQILERRIYVRESIYKKTIVENSQFKDYQKNQEIVYVEKDKIINSDSLNPGEKNYNNYNENLYTVPNIIY